MIRTVVGAVLCLVGILWIAQGLNLVHGSGMSGHAGYAVLGAVVFIVGALILRRGRWRR
ncbi:MAG: hypothetical protein WAM64_09800 [Acidimicrobiales bacterium]